IALAHDLGHPPFGHEGEEALDEVLREYLPDQHFRHYEQSLRVVDVLEKGGKGLNLTHETRDGILGHSKGRADLPDAASASPATTLPLEATVVRICDRIAYVNHDIDDAVRAGVLRHEDLPHETLHLLGRSHGNRITTMVMNVIDTSIDRPVVAMSEPILGATNRLKDFLFTNVYTTKNAAKAELAKGSDLLKRLFRLYMERPDLLPATAGLTEDMDLSERACAVLDYMAGMTDRYAAEQFLRQFFPRNWSGAPMATVV
ncbi:MAG: HD domain-containing protein, partial [Armatimonadota bacterium]